jgi:hypothetical protein
MWIHSLPRPKPLQPSSLANYVSSIRAIHATVTGQEWARTHLFSAWLSKLTKEASHSNPAPKPRCPGPKALLRLILADNSIDPAVRLACHLAFKAMLRSREYTATKHGERSSLTLSPEHIVFDSTNSHMTVTLPFVKGSDPGNLGPERHFYAEPDDPSCLVAATRTYLSWRLRAHPPNDPLFIHNDGRWVTRADIVAAVRKHCTTVGIPKSRIASHGFRYGAAFEMFEAGATWEDIQTHGRWGSDGAKQLAMHYASFSQSRHKRVGKHLSLKGKRSAKVTVVSPPPPSPAPPRVRPRARLRK